MVITITCPSCSSSFPVDPAKIPEGGVNARCSSCGDVFRVEKPVEPEPLPTLEELAPEVPEAPSMPEVAAPEPPPLPEVAAPEPPPMPDVVEPVAADPLPGLDEPAAAPEPAMDAPVADAFADPSLPEAPAAEPAVPEPTVPDPAPEPPAPEPEAASSVQGFTFGKRDPTDKARRLARVLVSDMIMYNAERHQSALAAGTLVQDFEEEIDKSWKEFVEQVGEDLANGEGRGFWTQALNDILAKGEQVF